MLLIDLSHTSHSVSQTGIQRVCRSLYKHLDSALDPRGVVYDPYAGYWRFLARREEALAQLSTHRSPQGKRGARWTLGQKLCSWTSRVGLPTGLSPLDKDILASVSAFLVPEVFTPKVAQAYKVIFPHLRMPKVAVFHDAVALRHPDLSPAKTVQRMPQYLHELLAFDGIAANSQASKEELLAYWSDAGITEHPPVEAIPLGTDFKPHIHTRPTADHVKILVVGTFEGRKNHLALLNALESLWAKGSEFDVQFVGGVNQETGTQAVKRLEELQTEGRPILWEGSLSDAKLEQAYAESHFTVYPSLYEGFGLPVLESLSFGKPCVCTSYGALKEAAEPGGCVQLENGESSTIANGIQTLLDDKALYQDLCEQARERNFKTWKTFAEEITAFASALAKG